MKINSTTNLMIEADVEMRITPAPNDFPTTSSNGSAIALFVRRSHDDLARSESPAPAPVPAPRDTVPPRSDLNVIYKCKNCGKRMKLSDAASYYGLPACPACVQACAPFEIVPEQSDSNHASSGNS